MKDRQYRTGQTGQEPARKVPGMGDAGARAFFFFQWSGSSAPEADPEAEAALTSTARARASAAAATGGTQRKAGAGERGKAPLSRTARVNFGGGGWWWVDGWTDGVWVMDYGFLGDYLITVLPSIRMDKGQSQCRRLSAHTQDV